MRFASIPGSLEGAVSDSAKLLHNLELATRSTGIETTEQVRSLAQLRANHEARRNAEMADFMSRFRAYCHADGSETEVAGIRFDEAINEQIKAIRRNHTAQTRTDTLDIYGICTITSDMLDGIRKAGLDEITPEIDAGYLRNKIEEATVQPINELLFDRYHVHKERMTLCRADFSSSQHTRAIDYRENTDDLPLHQRSNATAIQVLRYEGLGILGVNELNELPAKIGHATAETFKGFGRWATCNIERFEAFLSYRSGHDGNLTNDVKAVRFFLKQFGVTLVGKQRMEDGKRFMSYSVNAQEIANQNAIISLRRLKAEHESTITMKRQKKYVLPFRSNDPIALNTVVEPHEITSRQDHFHGYPYRNTVHSPLNQASNN